jgi:hypothetical protein
MGGSQELIAHVVGFLIPAAQSFYENKKGSKAG